MERLYRTRRFSKYKRRLGDYEKHLQDVFQKPILTERDKRVLLSIYYHRCLTTEQITEMHFKYDSRGKENSQAALIARRRLRKLFDYALVDRFFIDVGEGQGSSQAHVVLDALGAKVVAGLLNENVEDIQWRYEMNTTRLPYLAHMVSVNNFYLYLLRKAREQGHEVANFCVENHVRHEFNFWGQRHVFNPDAYGQYWIGNEGFHFFLEWDNGTMTPATFQKKHRRYAAFYASDEYRKFYETFPLVLTVTTNQQRRDQLRTVISETDNTDMMWLFSCAEDVERDVLGKIWYGKEEDPISLL